MNLRDLLQNALPAIAPDGRVDLDKVEQYISKYEAQTGKAEESIERPLMSLDDRLEYDKKRGILTTQRSRDDADIRVDYAQRMGPIGVQNFGGRVDALTDSVVRSTAPLIALQDRTRDANQESYNNLMNLEYADRDKSREARGKQLGQALLARAIPSALAAASLFF